MGSPLIKIVSVFILNNFVEMLNNPIKIFAGTGIEIERPKNKFGKKMCEREQRSWIDIQ